MYRLRFLLVGTYVASLLLILVTGAAAEVPVLVDTVGISRNVNDVSMASDHSVWAVGDSGTIWRKTGSSPRVSEWERVSVAGIAQEEWDFSGVFSMDSRLCWVVGEKNCEPDIGLGIVLKTTNGGRTWVYSVPTPPEREPVPFNSVHFANPRDGWIVAGDRYILKTEDGGCRWEWSWMKGDELDRLRQFER
jgi:photosystem II stability/assembly factor-like uncharacterized protein